MAELVEDSIGLVHYFWQVSGKIELGTTAHGIGAARALQVDADAGAYAGIALGLQVLLASLLTPLLFRWFG